MGCFADEIESYSESIRLVGLEGVYHLIQWKVLFRLNKESNFLLVDPEKYYFLISLISLFCSAMTLLVDFDSF